jgi:hypothetical protein
VLQKAAVWDTEGIRGRVPTYLPQVVQKFDKDFIPGSIFAVCNSFAQSLGGFEWFNKHAVWASLGKGLLRDEKL